MFKNNQAEDLLVRFTQVAISEEKLVAQLQASTTLTSRLAVPTKVSMQTAAPDRSRSNATFGASCYRSSRLSISSAPGNESAPSCHLEHREAHLTSDLHNRVRVRRSLGKKLALLMMFYNANCFFSTPNRLGNKRKSHTCPCRNTQADDALLSEQRTPEKSVELLELLPLCRPRKPANQPSCSSVSSCSVPRAQDANVNTDSRSYLKEFKDQ